MSITCVILKEFLTSQNRMPSFNLFSDVIITFSMTSLKHD